MSLDASYQVNWPFCSGEAKTRIFKIAACPPSWISDLKDFSYILQVTPILPTKFRVNWHRGVGGVGPKSDSLTQQNGRWTKHKGQWILTNHNSLS